AGLPGRLRHHQLRGRDASRPDDLELALLPLADAARRRDVLAALEADRPDDRRVLAARDVVADRLAIETDLRDCLRQDLQPGPAVAARPAIRLLAAELRGVRLEIGLRAGTGLRVPRPHAGHAFGAGRDDVAVELERGSDRRIEDPRIEANLLGLLAGEDGVGRIGDADEGVRVLVLYAAQHRRQVLDAERIALAL